MGKNRMRIDNSVKYSASFSKKLNAEKKKYTKKDKADTEKGKKCPVNEADCKSSINTPRDKDSKITPSKKRKETVDKQQVKKPDESTGTEKMLPNPIKNSEQSGNCVTEEIDCKLSLINIGYEDKEETENVTADQTMYEYENYAFSDKNGRSEDITDANTQNSTVVPPADNSKEKDSEKSFPEYDIYNYLSSRIIETVLEYTSDKGRKLTVIEGNPNPIKENLNLIENKDNIESVNRIENGESPEAENKIETDVKTIDDLFMKDDGDKKENLNRIADNKAEEGPSGQEETKSKDINNVFRKEGYFLKKENARKVLHTGAIYMENKIGYMGLFSVLGLFGIFTDNRACLGFFAFLYFIRYFLCIPDESFKASLLKAAAPAFFIDVIFSVLTIVLWLLTNNAVLFPIGLGTGMAVSLLAFTVIQAVNGKKKEGGNQTRDSSIS